MTNTVKMLLLVLVGTVTMVVALSLSVSAQQPVVNAGVVELKNGQRVEGKFQQATAAGEVVEVGGQALTFPLGQVRAIYFGGAPTPAGGGSAVGSSDEALQTLRGLESVLKSGVNYQDFSKRVLDARIVVDRVLPPDQPSKLREAMELYELIKTGWNVRITNNADRLASVGTAPALAYCPQALDAAKNKAMETRQNKPVESLSPLTIGLYLVGSRDGIMPDMGTQPLIACASERLR